MSLAFQSFERDVRLPPAELTPWEQALRHELVNVLNFVGRPLPITDWIDMRIGGEIETLRDTQSDAIWIRLRQREVKGKGQGKVSSRKARSSSKHEAFWSKLPEGEFIKAELRLRSTIFDFLAHWRSPEKATLADLCSDAGVGKSVSECLPKAVPLKEWIDRRLGEEVFFQTDWKGNEIVEVTPVAQEEIGAIVAGTAPEPDFLSKKSKKEKKDRSEGKDVKGEGKGLKGEGKGLKGEGKGPKGEEKGPKGEGKENPKRKRAAQNKPIDIHPANGNYKNVLDKFFWRIKGNPVTQSDMPIRFEKVEDGLVQATMYLPLLQGKAFTGEARPTEAEAKKSVWREAVDGLSDQIEEQNANLEARGEELPPDDAFI